MGAASPQLFAALVTNEVLTSILFEFVETDPQGAEQVFHTVRLTNAAVSSIHQYVAVDSPGGPGPPPLEHVGLTFQKIDVANAVGKTAALGR